MSAGQGNGPDARKQTDAGDTLPFGRFPHAIASDVREVGGKQLTDGEKLAVMPLMYFALQDGQCTASDWRLADYLGISVDSMTRRLNALERHGHITRLRVKPSAANMTGRVIILNWMRDPSYLPSLPDRRGKKGATREGPAQMRHPSSGGSGADAAPSDVQGAAAVRHRVPQPCGIGSGADAAQGAATGRDKEESCREKPEEPLKNARGEEKASGSRHEAEPPPAAPRPAPEPIAPPAVNPPSDSQPIDQTALTDPQRRVLAELGPERVARLEARFAEARACTGRRRPGLSSPRTLAEALEPFRLAVDPIVFKNLVEQSNPPRQADPGPPADASLEERILALPGALDHVATTTAELIHQTIDDQTLVREAVRRWCVKVQRRDLPADIMARITAQVTAPCDGVRPFKSPGRYWLGALTKEARKTQKETAP
jgi:hypothetical protein